MRKAAVELIGTFFLVLVIGLAVIPPGAGAMAPLAIGAILMVMVYAGGPISGAHYNPAVTLAVWLRGRCDTKDVPSYVGAQVLGATLAAGLVGLCKPEGVVSPMTLDIVPALLVEGVFTFALAFVVLNVATSKTSAGNSYFGLAIGFTLLAAAYAGGPISGGAFNPAVAVGLAWMGLSSWSNLWIFLAANLAGGALAALAFRLINAEQP
ncbi:MAG: aquaporin [Candidatus Omnitrophica bacterium]|nr:aquaporin [Candidatus Omnitrophota bacterium]